MKISVFALLAAAFSAPNMPVVSADSAYTPVPLFLEVPSWIPATPAPPGPVSLPSTPASLDDAPKTPAPFEERPYTPWPVPVFPVLMPDVPEYPFVSW